MKIKSTPSMLSLALAAGFAGAFTWSADSHACAAEPLIGSVCFTAIGYCPQGYFPADARLLPIQQYQALYALIGTTYGGDGKTTFALPDLRGRSPVGVTSSITSGGVPISAISHGYLRGQETSVLQQANLPPAGSSGGPAVVNATTNPATASTPAAGMQLATPKGTYGRDEPVAVNMYATAGGTQVPLGSVSGGGSGGGNSTPFTNLPPQIGLSACIAWNGIWPSRPD